MSRRSRLLRVGTALALLFALQIGVAESAQASPADTSAAAKTKTATPIKHFITLMQENHSFDNYFGTYPGADGPPQGVCVPVKPDRKRGRCVPPFRVSGRPIVDLGHTANIHKAQYANGKMNGFISAFSAQRGVGDLAMGYYDDRDIPFYWNVADDYVLFDRAFTSAAGGSVWNHFYWVSGGPGNHHLRPTAGGRSRLEVLHPELRSQRQFPKSR
jgi:phospholipase C